MEHRMTAAAGAAALAGAALALSGCTYDPAELEFYEARFVPSRICSGEALWFGYTTTEDFDHAELRAADGTLLARVTDREGHGMTEPFRAEWMPLTVHVQVGDRVFVEPVTDLVLIDDDEWVSYDSDRELGSDLERVPVGTVQEWDTELGQMVDVTLYDVYRTFTGFTWDVPASDFSPRAHLLRIRNEGGRALRFAVSWSWPLQEWELAPGEVAALPAPARPWASLWAELPAPQRRLVGRQKGEDTKPPNEHFEYTDLYTEITYPVGLEVVCMDAPPSG